jgi:predicted NBD/HSP70 family sugar kinase
MTLADAVLQAGWTAADPHPDAPAARRDLLADPDGDGPVVGIDVGGTKIHGAAWTSGVPALVESATFTDPAGGPATLDQLADLAAELCQGRRPSSVVLGLPGVPQADGTLAHAPNLPGWDVLDVPAELRRRIGAPVVMENDVAMAAWGEHLWGGEADLAFVAIGTGIGVGTVQGGRLVRGAEGSAGEVFDLPLVTGSAVPDARQLEDLASGPGLEREYAARSGAVATTREVLDRLGEDPAAAQAVAAVAAAVAQLVVSIRCLLDPGVVVLGGGLGTRPEIVAAVRRELDDVAPRPVRIRASVLGPRAATVGALGRARARAAGGWTEA